MIKPAMVLEAMASKKRRWRRIHRAGGEEYRKIGFYKKLKVESEISMSWLRM